MLSFIRDIITTLSTKYIGDWLETKAIPLIASISASVGSYMCTQQIIGAILVSVPIIHLIYIYNQNNSIKGKFVIRTTSISLEGEKDAGKLYLIIECENLSNQVIQFFANLDKSSFKVETNSAVSLTKHKDKEYTVKQQIFPYSHQGLRYGYFYIDDVLKLAEAHNNIVVLDFNIALKYGHMNKKCNQEAIFCDKGNLKIQLIDRKIHYEYKSCLKLLD